MDVTSPSFGLHESYSKPSSPSCVRLFKVFSYSKREVKNSSSVHVYKTDNNTVLKFTCIMHSSHDEAKVLQRCNIVRPSLSARQDTIMFESWYSVLVSTNITLSLRTKIMLWDFRLSQRRVWDIGPYTVIKVHRRFRGVYYLHHQRYELLSSSSYDHSASMVQWLYVKPLDV
jgi:hypothetical protein